MDWLLEILLKPLIQIHRHDFRKKIRKHEKESIDKEKEAEVEINDQN